MAYTRLCISQPLMSETPRYFSKPPSLRTTRVGACLTPYCAVSSRTSAAFTAAYFTPARSSSAMAALQLGQVGDLNSIASAPSRSPWDAPWATPAVRSLASAACSAFAAWAWDSSRAFACSAPGFSKAASMVARSLGFPERRSALFCSVPGFINTWAGAQQPDSIVASMAAS